MTHPLLLQPASRWGTLWDAAMRGGDFENAWTISDQVLASRDPTTRDDPALPYHQRWVWDGRPLDGQDVLVRCYHGLGDTLQFWRYLPVLAQRAASVTVEVQPALIPLLNGPYQLIPFRPEAPAPFRCDIEIMELSHALRLPPPPPEPLDLNPLPRPAPGRLIGVCWAAGDWDRERSVPLDLLRPLARYGALVSLQRGPANDTSVLDPTGGSMDALDTARLICGLDLVVTVDTMVAHLAGLTRTPTYVLLKHAADWRWGRDVSPWYPRHQLFRQPGLGAWELAVRPLMHTLEKLAAHSDPEITRTG